MGVGVMEILGAARVRGAFRGLGIGEAQQPAIDKWRLHMAQAQARFLAPVSDAAARYRQVSGIVSETTDLIGEIGSMQTTEDVFRFMDTLSTLLTMTGPVGAMAGWLVDLINDVAGWLVSEYPAFTIQLQNQHYAYLDKWTSEALLGIIGNADYPSAVVAGVKGWVPIYVLPAPQFCLNSGGRLGNWDNGPGRPVTENEDNLRNFSWISGRRETAITRCAGIRPADMAAWIASPEGVVSIAEGRALAETLSSGGFTASTLQGGSCKVYKSGGLVFADNLMYDIGSGSHHYNIWLNVVLVNVAGLPDELLIPLGTWLMLTYEAASVYGTEESIPSEERHNIRKAAFGQNDESFKRWNLLRVLYDAGVKRASVAILSEIAARGSSSSGGGVDKAKGTPKPWSTTKKVVVAGGVATGVGVGTYLLGLSLGWWK